VRFARVAAAVAVGAVATIVTTAVAGLPAHDAIVLVGVAFGTGIGSFALGSALMGPARRFRGVAFAAAVVALIPVVSVVAGALAAAKAMFVSTHDLSALVIIIIGAGTAGVLGAFALATELTVARQDADDAIERERRLERSRRELVAWVSHDLRTPLAGMRAMIEAIDDGIVEDEQTIQRYHHQLSDEVDRLARLVDDLFELSRIEGDMLRLTMDRMALGDVVSDAMAAATALADAKGVRVEGRIAPVTAPIVASGPELTRVISNLLDNAIRHTPAGGAVSVEVGSADRSAVVSVRDQCGGIPDVHIDRVFEAAYRGDEARTPGGGGGLGLAIARGLVEAHHGAIDVVNEDDGCCFTITLPLVER
jgi:signal transduction histidine kinase